MPSSDSSRDALLERLAEEFVERHRRGERPALSEYVNRHPDLAAEVRELFPALVQIEKLKPAAGDLTGAFVPTSPPREEHTPERFGEFRILRQVGHGGMGVVYEAEQESLGRHVALKVLPRQALLKATYLERFRREAKAAGRLHHTNIVPVFGVGECDGTHYYAMQFIPGEGLDKVLHDLRRLRATPGGGPAAANPAEASVAHSLLTGRFVAAPTSSPEVPAAGPAPSGVTPADRAHGSSTLSVGGSESEYYRGVARLALQAADALAYAHRQGILHRDIKPSNLLLDLQGTVWITDFGLAKAEGADDLTQTGDIVGTVRYMAPERFDGRSLPQGDVYALGVTLYELLTLRPAFDDANRARLIDKVLHEPPAPPRKLDRGIPRDLETVVLKCLAKDPRDRYATAEALADDLRRFLADRPIGARRATAVEQAWRWCRRNPVVAGLAAAVLLSLLLGAVVASVFAVRAEASARQAQEDRDKARAAERQGRKQLFEAVVADAWARRFSGRVGQRFGTLASVRRAAALARELGLPPATFDELRDLAVAALALPDMHRVKEWEGWPEGSRGVAFDDRLERYARIDAGGNITVRRLADDAEIARRPGGGPPVGLGGFDEDGRALLLLNAADKSLRRWRFAGNKDVDLGKNPVFFSDDLWLTSTADRKLLVALNRKTGTLGVHDLATGRHLRDIRFGKWATGKHAVPEHLWNMHPWKHELAVSLGVWHDPERQVVRVLDLDRGRVKAELVTNPRMRTSDQLAWHPDGRTLAVAYVQVVLLWDVPSGRYFRVISEHKGGALSAAVSRSGQLMSTHSGWAGGVKFWHPYTGKLLLSLPTTRIHPTTQTPDGRMCTYRTEGTRLELWATEPSPVLRVLVRSPIRGRLQEYRRASVRRDGRLLAVGSSDGVSLFDLDRGLDVGHLDVGSALTAQFDPATGDLLTFGTLGLLRWPVRQEPGTLPRLRVGPPQRLLARPASDNEFRVSRDGRTIAAADYSRAFVLHADRPDRPLVLGPTIEVRTQISLSPDGRWVATGSHGLGDILVWDARSGRLVKRHRVNYSCSVRFTPDGKRLLAWVKGRCLCWQVGAWDRPPRRIDLELWINPEFSPDGKLLPAESGDGAMRLLSTDTGRELVRLESPDQGRCHYTTFSPDGRYFIGTNMDFATVQVWDLRALREQLRELDLDWKADPDPPAAKRDPDPPGTPPLSVEIDLGGLGGVAKKRDNARRQNDEAWHLVTGPADKRDPVRALRLIRQALQGDPDNPHLWNTLGVVQYRNGQVKEAVATLNKSLAAGNGQSDAFDLFFLALCHAKLGDRAKPGRASTGP
jgi:serine/threonine protein kinase/WD40 repeat protein